MRYEDQSHTGGNVLDGPNVIDVDPFSPVTLNRLPSQVIIADRGDEHDLRAGSPGRHGLIGALATGRGRERVSQHGLPGRRKHGNAHGHIRIARANNDHPTHEQVLLMRNAESIHRTTSRSPPFRLWFQALDHGVHAAESEIAEALSKGYNSLTVTPAYHGDQLPVPIPHSPFPFIPHGRHAKKR